MSSVSKGPALFYKQQDEEFSGIALLTVHDEGSGVESEITRACQCHRQSSLIPLQLFYGYLDTFTCQGEHSVPALSTLENFLW